MKISRKTLILLHCFLITTSAQAINLLEGNRALSRRYVFSHDALDSKPAVSSKFHRLFSAHYNYVKAPLTVLSGRSPKQELVKEIHALFLSYSQPIKPNLYFFWQTIGAVVNTDRIIDQDSTSMGDSTVGLKWGLTKNSLGSWAFIPSLTLPTGTNHFISTKRVGLAARMAIEKSKGQHAWVYNLGLSFNSGNRYQNAQFEGEINLEQILFFSASYLYTLNPKWQFNLDFYRKTSLPFNDNQNPSEFYAGLRQQFSQNLSLWYGVAVGQFLEKTANDFRLALGLQVAQF